MTTIAIKPVNVTVVGENVSCRVVCLCMETNIEEIAMFVYD